MSFLAILVALLLEQARPLTSGNLVHTSVRSWVRWAARNFDAGRPSHGWLAWGFSVVVPALAALVIHWVLVATLGWSAAVVWNIVVLYVTLGFRQFSHHFTGIRDALEGGDEELARALLARWQQIDAKELPRSEIIRQVIEHSVLAAHRHVFGVLAWYSVLAALGLGPAGAIFYRLSEFVARYWKYRDQSLSQPVSKALQVVAVAAWRVVDWLPARITAFAFAVVGSFEDTIDNWRNVDQGKGSDNDDVILAATAGAVNLNLRVFFMGEPPQQVERRSAARVGQTPELAHLRTIVGLVWRTVVMWMLLLALLTLARLLG
jgi:adenosylcobinamide-phosphate synthase